LPSEYRISIGILEEKLTAAQPPENVDHCCLNTAYSISVSGNARMGEGKMINMLDHVKSTYQSWAWPSKHIEVAAITSAFSTAKQSIAL